MAGGDRTPQQTLADRALTARSACLFLNRTYLRFGRSTIPPLGGRGFTGSITHTTTTDFGKPADAISRGGDFTRHDITLNPVS